MLMLYIEHNEYRNKLSEAQKKYDEILAEKEKLFAMTQPKAMMYDKDKISGGRNTDSFTAYLIAKEKKRLDERLEEIKSIVNDRAHLLNLKEQELRASKNWYDKIYVDYHLEQWSVAEIARKIPYCQSRIFEMLNEINLACNLRKRRKNSGVN